MMLLPALLLTLATTQTVTETGATLSTTASIEQIDQTTREVTLKFEDGTTDTMTVGPNVKRFDQLKVGDQIKFHYYESIAYQVHKAGSPEAEAAAKNTGEAKVALTPGSGAAPGATAAKQRRETVTVTKVDPEQGSITVKTADGHIVSRKVKDKKNLEGISPGDQIEIVYTEALLVSIDSPT
jgi:Cu/Ag efflux protein CusF